MSLSEKRPRQFIATIDSGAVTATVSGGQLADVGTIGTILSPISVGAIAAIGTIGTLQAGAVTASVSGGQLQDVATIGTILSPVAIGAVSAVATIGTVQFGNVTASVSGGALSDVGTVGTLISGYVTVQQAYLQTNVQTNQNIIASGASTILAGTLQDLVVDMVYGSIVGGAGSIRTSVLGVDPQANVQTSTIVGGDWAAGTGVNQAQRLVAVGPLGVKIAVAWTVAGVSTVVGVYITAEQSLTG